MRKLSVILFVNLLACWPLAGRSQQATKPVYMQIFYEGSGWLAGREVLHYSPTFQGRTGELVREDSTQAMSPGALVFDGPVTVTEGVTKIFNGRETLIRGTDGKMHPQTEADIRAEQTTNTARMNRSLNLLATRAALGRMALTKALNETAAGGWEVVQMTSWGTSGGLVYLLRRR